MFWPALKMPPLVPIELLVFMPSRAYFMSAVGALWIDTMPCSPAPPPTSEPLVTPLATDPRVSAEKLLTVCAVGSVSSTSRVRLFCVLTFCTSTIGLEPETVTVSSRPPTFSSASTGAVKPAVSVTPSRFTVAKPDSENVTV